MSLFKKFSYCVILLPLAMMNVGAQEKAKQDSVIKLSLKEAQVYAMTNNKSILNANMDVESAKAKVWETTASGLPQVSGKGSYSYMPVLSPTINEFTKLLPDLENDQQMKVNDSILYKIVHGASSGFNPSAMKWAATADLTVSQLVFSGSYLVALQSAKVYKSLSELNKSKSSQDVYESVTDSYFSVLIAREDKQILDSTYHNMQQMLSDMELMFQQGFTEETDVDQMKITLGNVKSSLEMINRQQSLAEMLLKVQLGIGLDQKLELTDQLDPLIQQDTYEQLLLADFVVEQNINYQMMDVQVKSSTLLLKLEESKTLPEVSAFYQYEKNFNPDAITFNPPNMFGASITIPIFSSGERWARIKQAKLDLQKSINNRDVMADNMRIQYLLTKSSLMDAKDKYVNDRQNLDLSQKIYIRSMAKYKQGIISSTDLTQVQNQFLTAQSTYYQTIQNLISQKNLLEKLLTKN